MNNTDAGLMRIGNPEKVQVAVKPLLQENLKAHTNEHLPGKQVSFFQSLRELFLGSSKGDSTSIRVIGATCVGSDNSTIRSFGIGEEKIDLVIIDEAGRGTAMETLIPMRYADRVVLVGDQNVGKSSIIARYIRNEFDPTKNVSIV